MPWAVSSHGGVGDDCVHHCGPSESMATVLGMQDVPRVFGMGLWCSVSIQRAERGVLVAFWGMNPHMKWWLFDSVTWASLTSSPETSVGLGGPGDLPHVGDLNLSWPRAPAELVLGTEGLCFCLALGSRPPSVEDVLQDGSCGEHRSLTQSESDPPVDVYLPGNGCTLGVGGTIAADLLRLQPQFESLRVPGGVVDRVPDHGSLPGWGGMLHPRDGTGMHLPGVWAPASSQWAERAVGEGG